MELFPNKMKQESLSPDLVVERLVYLENAFQLIHWQTSSYSQHQATGAAYTYINSFKDEVVEKLMGYTGKRPSAISVKVSTIGPLIVVSEAMTFASQLKMYGEMNAYHDICNLADSFSGEMAKIKFLLTLT